MWLDTDEMGIIKTFTSYGGSDADFLIDLIGYIISEYDYDIGLFKIVMMMKKKMT